MKTLKKIILSLLITVGISNVNLSSMVRDGFLIVTNNTMISEENILKTGVLGINLVGRVFYLNAGYAPTQDVIDIVYTGLLNMHAGYASTQDVIDIVYTSLLNMEDTRNFPEFDEEALDASRAELREEEVNGGHTWGFRQKAVGTYYDIEDQFSLEDKFSTAYNWATEKVNILSVKLQDGLTFEKAREIADFVNSKITKRGVSIVVEASAVGFAAFRLVYALNAYVPAVEQYVELSAFLATVIGEAGYAVYNKYV